VNAFNKHAATYMQHFDILEYPNASVAPPKTMELTKIILPNDDRHISRAGRKVALYKVKTGNGRYIYHSILNVHKKEAIMSTKALFKPAETFPSLMEDFFKPLNEWFGNGGPGLRTVTLPSVNISEDKDEYKVDLAVPGLKKSDFKINVEGNVITISSEKEEKKEEKDVRFTRHEYSYSSFSRSFTLPSEVNADKIEAGYADGVLSVHLPKREEAKKTAASRQISIK
jgi:HSP20 family protein